ncbi:MAG: hypothetical protein JW940_15570 [Polyangiaceae bacterium]|nr:hypothetical protein [Polyangiaceae bacterium]
MSYRTLVSVVFTAFLLSACSTDDACEKSVAKWEHCGVRDAGEPRECTNKEDECVADCVNDSSCEDIMDVDTEGDYVRCLLGCVSQ